MDTSGFVMLVVLLLGFGALGGVFGNGTLSSDPEVSISTESSAPSKLCKDGRGCDPECRTLLIISYDFHQMIKSPEFDLLTANKQKTKDIAEGKELLSFENTVENLTKSLIFEMAHYKQGFGHNGTGYSSRRANETPGQAFCESGRCMWTRIPNVHISKDSEKSDKDVQVFWQALGGICQSDGFVDSVVHERDPELLVVSAPPPRKTESSGHQMKAAWTFGLLFIALTM